MFQPINQAWWILTLYDTVDTTPPASAPPGNIPWNLQHPQRPGIWACTDHPGGADRWLKPNGFDGDQYHLPGLFSQQASIIRGVLAYARGGGWRRAGGGWPGHPGLTPDIKLRVKVLPQAKLGEL